MKKSIVWTLAGTTSFLVSLAVMAPLPIIAQQMMRWKPEIQMAGVNGTLWKGEIQQLSLPSTRISDLSWTFNPRQLLSGYLGADLQATVQQAKVTGACGVSMMTHVQCKPLNLTLAARDVKLPALQAFELNLGGDLRATLNEVFWDRKTLPSVEGKATWAQGEITSPQGKLSLEGDYNAILQPASKASDALDIKLESRETKVILDGTVTVAKDGVYQTNLSLKAASGTEPSVAQGLSMLEMAGIGAAQPDGSIRIKQDGKLALNFSSSPETAVAQMPQTPVAAEQLLTQEVPAPQVPPPQSTGKPQQPSPQRATTQNNSSTAGW
ncbi:type II secretion system protein N [Thiolinea disciformis]|uniref:type II secretion system protein N n=1 Tax=Thiolinea disciformis TaxID=125614 RepID=UPI00037AA6C4|nr:type II secretion system protein N [Thiolinea disciformis]